MGLWRSLVVDVFEVLLARNAWEKRKLGELANIRRGASPRPIKSKKWFSQTSQVGWIRISDVTEQNGRIHQVEQHLSDAGQKKTLVLKSKHLLLSIAATVGKPVQNYIQVGVHDGFIVFMDPKFDLDFMFYFLEKYRPNWARFGQPGSQININSELVRDLVVSIPTVHEQDAVAQFIITLDNLIAATQRRIDALEQAKKALLQRLFDQSWRFKGYSDPWEKRKLGETNSYFTDGNYGESYPKESELSDKENGVPFLRGSNLRNGELIEDNANYITKEKHAELTSGHLVEDDIVLAVRGSLGALGYVKDENIDWNINSQLAVIRTDKSELSGKFLVQFLLSWRGQKELLSRNTGTALKQLPIKQLKDVPVPIVNLDEQKEIGALFSSIDNLIAATQSRLSSLELLKKSLLQDLFI